MNSLQSPNRSRTSPVLTTNARTIVPPSVNKYDVVACLGIDSPSDDPPTPALTSSSVSSVPIHHPYHQDQQHYQQQNSFSQQQGESSASYSILSPEQLQQHQQHLQHLYHLQQTQHAQAQQTQQVHFAQQHQQVQYPYYPVQHSSYGYAEPENSQMSQPYQQQFITQGSPPPQQQQQQPPPCYYQPQPQPQQQEMNLPSKEGELEQEAMMKLIQHQQQQVLDPEGASIEQRSNQQYQLYLQQTQTQEFQQLLHEANATHESRLFEGLKNRKQKRRLASVFVRMGNTLDSFAKQIETSGNNVSEKTKKITVEELDRDLAEMWAIITSSGMVFGVCLMFLGIPGLCVLLASLVAALFCQTTTRGQAQLIVRGILPLTRRLTSTLTKSTSGSIKASAKSIRFFAIGKKKHKMEEDQPSAIVAQILAENSINN